MIRTYRKARERHDERSLIIHRDGREVCNMTKKAGREEYKRRTEEMRLRQHGLCCLADYCPTCPKWLSPEESTFDHEFGRGMGGSKRDDRVERDGERINGAAHSQCNIWKGSRFVDYNHRSNRQKRVISASEPVRSTL